MAVFRIAEYIKFLWKLNKIIIKKYCKIGQLFDKIENEITYRVWKKINNLQNQIIYTPMM